MRASTVLRQARRRAGLTQRGLAGRAEVPQPAIARIESGRVIPRVDTLDHLLRACGEELTTTREIGRGVDRTLIRMCLDRTPSERLELARIEAKNLRELMAARR